MIAFSVQGALLVRYARKMDGLSLAFYRNVSFFITLLPLLAFSSTQEILMVLSHWKALLISGALGGISLTIVFSSYKFIAIGMGNAIGRASGTIVVAILGFFIFGETLSPVELLLIGIIVIACVWLATQQAHTPHISQRAFLGIALSIAAAIPVTFTFVILADIARITDPLASGYFWEVAISASTLIIVILRTIFFKKGLQKIDRKTALGIATCSSPTLIGTGCYALALSMGPIALVSAIGTGSLFITGLLAWRWYNEKLRNTQWVAMTIILASIVMLKFV